MDSNDALLAFSALSQGTRSAALRLLVACEPDGLGAGEIGCRLGGPPDTLSSHLGIPTRADLVAAERRSRSLADFLLGDGRRAHPEACGTVPTASPSSTPFARSLVPDRSCDVLFPCTGGTARSILAESILRKVGDDRFTAGSRPKGEGDRFASRGLEKPDHPTDGLRSKSSDEFAGPDAPVIDFVFTVCDSADGEACPVWPGHSITALAGEK